MFARSGPLLARRAWPALPLRPCGAEIRSRDDAIGGVSIIRPISIAEENRRRHAAVIGAVIKIIHGRVAAAEGNQNGVMRRRSHADLGGNIRPTVRSERVVSQRRIGKIRGYAAHDKSRSNDRSPRVSHIQPPQ
jgi:hypothetical protein